MSDLNAARPPRAPGGPTASNGRSAPRGGNPLRYSMRSLLILVTIVAVIAAVVPYTGLAATLLLIGLITLLLVGPVCLGTLALYCRGYKQTFFLGAFAGSLSTFYLGSTLLRFGNDLGALIAMCVVGAAAAGACACVAVGTRRFIERRGWNRPAELPREPPPQ